MVNLEINRKFRDRSQKASEQCSKPKNNMGQTKVRRL